jgi:hypothetical protein
VAAIQHEVKRAIYSIFKEKKRFPNLQEMCDVLNFSAENTRKCMAALAENGHIEKIGDWYRYPENHEEIMTTNKEVREDHIPVIDHIPEFEFPVEEEKKRFVVSVAGEIIDKSNFAEVKENEIVKIPDITIKRQNRRSILKKINDSYKESTTLFKKWESQKIKDNKSFLEKPEKRKKIKKDKDDGIRENITLYGVPIYVIQVCMGVIGIGASIISIYYTAVWLVEFLPVAFALLLSSIMVGFSVSAFETVILFLSGQVAKSRWTKIFIASGFAVLWIIVSCFSIMSTVAGQYNKHIANIREQTRTGVESGKASWSILQERKADLIKRMAEHRQQTGILNQLLSGMGDIKSRTDNTQLWNETQYRLSEANKEIMKTSDELNKIRSEEERQIKESKRSGTILSSTGSETLPDFYGWLAGIFKAQRDWIQFIMSLFPAVFVDIISPVGVALALFLRNKYKKKEEF